MARKDFNELSELLLEMLNGLERVRERGGEFTVKDVLQEIWEEDGHSPTQKQNIGAHFFHLVEALHDVESTGQKRPLAYYRFRPNNEAAR